MRILALALTLFALAANASEPLVHDYVRAFNEGEEAIAAFFTKNLAQSTLAQKPMPARLEVYRRMKADFGTLTIGGVLAEGNTMRVRARTSSGKALLLLFTFESDKLLGLAVELDEGGDGPPPQGAANVDPSTRIDAAKTYLDAVAAHGFKGAAMIVIDGQVALNATYGHALGTVFDIGSLVKDFTRAAIMGLAASGKLSLDDTLAKYFPKLPADKAAITLRQLLDHASGLPLGIGPDPELLTKDAFLARLASTPLGKPTYSNPGFTVLAAVVEQVTGKPYEQYVRETIFEPKGMKDTGYVLPKWPASRRAHAFADGIDEGSTFDYPHLPDGNSYTMRGNGGMLATLEDMRRFYAGEGKMGVDVGGNFTHYFLHHAEPRLTILLASTDSAFPAMPVDRKLTAILRGKDVPVPPAANVAPPASLTGTYRANGGTFLVRRDGNFLVVTPVDQTAIDALRGMPTPNAAQWNERAAKLVKGTVIGSHPPAALPPGAMMAGSPPVMYTDVRTGDTRSRIAWSEGFTVRKIEKYPTLGGRRFLFLGGTDYAAYDLRKDEVTRMTA
ncbi:MAG TPA: serine hydrolase domain-containing protein, partial [Thermoanaerobaculia bacterium]